MTAAINVAWPRKFAASQPTTRISSADRSRGKRRMSTPVAPGAPGIASASMPIVAKTMKMPQNATSFSTCDGGR